MPRASIILCTYNRAALLKRLFDALTRQSVGAGAFEVVVVDDASADSTPDVCRRAARGLPGLRCLRLDANVGHAGASCVGIREAKGDVLLFTDDDCIPRDDWVERMCAALADDLIVAGAVDSPRGDFIKLCHNVAQFQEFLPDRPARGVGFAPGANMGMRRSVIDAAGVSDDRRRHAFDTELILRARAKGLVVRFHPESVVLHDPPSERSRLLGILKYSADHATATISLRRQYASLLRTPLVLRSPSLLLLTSPVIAAAVTVRIFTRDRAALRFWATAPVVFLVKLAWCWGAARGLRTLQRGEGGP
jgi:GT2 family glycosyltransferase